MADDKKVKNPSEKLKEATKIASKAKQQSHVYNDVEEAVLKVMTMVPGIYSWPSAGDRAI